MAEHAISIHALRKESDALPQNQRQHLTISIHALRKESDHMGHDDGHTGRDFNPRSP